MLHNPLISDLSSFVLMNVKGHYVTIEILFNVLLCPEIIVVTFACTIDIEDSDELT